MNKFDPKLDLLLERVVDVPRNRVWACWTTPKHVMKWFTPVPWKTVACKIDLRPGGIFHTVMRSPEGKDYPGTGCYLEVVKYERLVWTGLMLPGFRPASMPEEPAFTAIISLKAQGKRTKYSAHVMHRSEVARKSHEAMGFHDGWGKALEQLVAVAKKL